MPDTTHEQVEELLKASGLKYSRVAGRDGIWELTFMMKTAPFTIQIDNGVGNSRFLSVTLMYMKALANRAEFFHELLKKTGQVAFAKFGLTEDGDVLLRASVPRGLQSDPLEKLKASIGAVLQAADQWYVELLMLAGGETTS